MSEKQTRKGRKNAVERGRSGLFADVAALPATPENLDKYRRHLDHLDMPEERKTELLLSLRTIMRSFVDRAFGDDPVQQCRRHVDETQAIDETGIPPVIHFADDPTDPDNNDLSATFRHYAGKRGRRKR